MTDIVERLRTRNGRADGFGLGPVCDEAADTIERLRSVMVAAAEEIAAHWDAHCDAEGYGPANLQRRLEEGIPSQYGYTAGAFAELKAENDRLRAALAAPPEWVLVPVEPTEAMQAVIRNECDIYGSEWALYAAMLAAAPGAPDALEGTP